MPATRMTLLLVPFTSPTEEVHMKLCSEPTTIQWLETCLNEKKIHHMLTEEA
jgi:hypothetical protein